MTDLLTATNFRLLMGLSFLPIGLFSILAGLYMLISSTFREEAKILAQQSAKISQKALTDGISMVTQSATALIDSVNNLIRTSSGNAILLVIIGALCELAAYWLLIASK